MLTRQFNGLRLVLFAEKGAFYNHGQSCCAGSRIYVHEEIYDQFVEKLAKKAKSIKLGDQMHPDTEMGKTF